MGYHRDGHNHGFRQESFLKPAEEQVAKRHKSEHRGAVGDTAGDGGHSPEQPGSAGNTGGDGSIPDAAVGEVVGVGSDSGGAGPARAFAKFAVRELSSMQTAGPPWVALAERFAGGILQESLTKARAAFPFRQESGITYLGFNRLVAQHAARTLFLARPGGLRTLRLLTFGGPLDPFGTLWSFGAPFGELSWPSAMPSVGNTLHPLVSAPSAAWPTG